MPIGTGIVYNAGDLILSQVSGSGTAFLETKIAAATSSLIYFDSTARINSASLNSITVGTASYVSGSRSIIWTVRGTCRKHFLLETLRMLIVGSGVVAKRVGLRLMDNIRIRILRSGQGFLHSLSRI